MIKQSQQQRFLQRLSPQQIQIMKLLQVPTALLEDRIKDELEENPALEYGEEADEDEYGLKSKNDADENFDDTDDTAGIELSDDGGEKIDLEQYLRQEDEGWGSSSYDYTNDDDNAPNATAGLLLETSFHEFLLSQLRDLGFNSRRNAIAEQVIGSIDDDGYLRREVPSLVDDLAFARNISTTPEEVEEIIGRIRTFDPPGVGAWTLQECLILQLRRLQPQTPETELSIKVLDKYFLDFTRKNYERIQKSLDLDDERFRQIIGVITKLTPRPGAAYGSVNKAETYIVPDFFVYNNGGKLEVSLNARNAPDLRISENYRDMMLAYDRSTKKNREQREALNFIKQKLDGAKWFIDAIRQRQQTLLQTMHAILHIQRNFFLSGDESTLVPMVLRNVAEATGLDISTISRVSSSKYVQTEFGTYKLKFFFSESMQTDSGEEVSSREIKSHLMSFIAEEDKLHPLADETLTDMLKEKGYNVARRTVAKYREGLSIPVARLRREL